MQLAVRQDCVALLDRGKAIAGHYATTDGPGIDGSITGDPGNGWPVFGKLFVANC